MRIAFIDASGWDFNVDTPFHRPLGGSQSAASYLAIALAEAGNHVFFISATTKPGVIHGVTCISVREFAPTQLPELKLDAAVLVMGAGAGMKMREALGPGPKLVLWTGHAADQEAVAALKDPIRRGVFDGFAMVSDWQREQYLNAFALPADSTAVLRNAVAPAFLEQFKLVELKAGESNLGESIAKAKSRPPVLAYTSTPYRGLDVLLKLFPQIRRRSPGATLQVFSGMSVYMASQEQDEKDFGHLYRLCRETEGVELVGALPQPILATRLRDVSVLTYSNTFAETSCISVLEAIACGCRIVTSELGALPETTAGFATLVSRAGGPGQYESDFVDATVRTIAELDTPATADALARQISFVADRYNWTTRAGEWERWLTKLERRGQSVSPRSSEQHFPVAHLPKNHEAMDPYFGQFLGLLRRSLANGGSEFGLGLTLFSLAASIRADSIIEIGRFKGFSTLALASALRLVDLGWDEPAMHKERPDIDYKQFEGPKKRQVVSIDPHPTPEATALLKEAGLLSYVTMLDSVSADVDVQGEVDLIFIDGDHSYQGCLADVRRLVPKNLRPGGYFILHDYYGWYDKDRKSASPVRHVIEELVAEGELEHLLIDTGYMSFVVFRRPNATAQATLARL
jgi:glycosyltransferase involved in cell wall biosynthesis/predicted O-methyltransferase YrrM